MSTQPIPDPTQGGASGGAPSAPSQAPANPQQIMLAQMFQMCKKLAQQDPTLASGLGKAAEGINEAQTALMTSPQPVPVGATPPQ